MLKILMVDDDAEFRRAFARQLRHKGCVVSELAEPRQLLERIAVERPDAVLLDISMPFLRGDQACALIKADPRFAATPVYIISGHSSFGAIQQCTNAGADGYLVKPTAVSEVLALIQRQCWARLRVAA